MRLMGTAAYGGKGQGKGKGRGEGRLGHGGRGRSKGGEKPMGTTAYGGKGSKGRAANGGRPIGTARCIRDHHTQGVMPNPPSPSQEGPRPRSVWWIPHFGTVALGILCRSRCTALGRFVLSLCAAHPEARCRLRRSRGWRARWSRPQALCGRRRRSWSSCTEWPFQTRRVPILRMCAPRARVPNASHAQAHTETGVAPEPFVLGIDMK